jgi:hypothetical protein
LAVPERVILRGQEEAFWLATAFLAVAGCFKGLSRPKKIEQTGGSLVRQMES